MSENEYLRKQIYFTKSNIILKIYGSFSIKIQLTG